MRQDYKKENGEILAYISVGISCETRVRRNYLCSCAIALMHLTRGRMETDKLLPAAGIWVQPRSMFPSPTHPLSHFFRGNTKRTLETWMILIMFYGSSKYNIRNRVNCGIPPKISARYKFCNGGERVSVACQVSANHISICLKSVFSAYFMHQQMSLEQKTAMSTLFMFIIFWESSNY